MSPSPLGPVGSDPHDIDDLLAGLPDPLDLSEFVESEAQLSELLRLIDADELEATRAQRAYLAGAHDVLKAVTRLDGPSEA